jgi:hypothetical protein
MGIWKLKGVRGNIEKGICPMCSKEEVGVIYLHVMR